VVKASPGPHEDLLFNSVKSRGGGHLNCKTTKAGVVFETIESKFDFPVMQPHSSIPNRREMKPIADWTVREWLQYHQESVHQGSLKGSPELQQTWMGRTIWKNPLDCWVYQEILYDTRPEVIVELGVAHGGGTLYLANLFDLLGMSEGRVIGVDMDLGRVNDLHHPRIQLIEGQCLDPSSVREVASQCQGRKTMVIADCDHNKDHVMEELRTYSPLVTVGCYYIVEDGICDVMAWPPVPGPQAACVEFLRGTPYFVDDAQIREKYLITYNFNGYLKRVR
jgi:cephalosporin hydroxylase